MRLLALVLVIALPFFFIPPVIQAADSSSWLQVGGDSAHSSVNAAEVDVNRCSANNLTVKWSAPYGRTSQGTPTIADGRLYVGTEIGTVYALDYSTGSIYWSSRLNGRVSTPVVSGGRLFVVNGRYLTALDRFTGAVLWSDDVSTNGYQSPVVSAGLVLVGSSSLRAYDANSGAMEWEYGSSVGVTHEPAILDGQIYVASNGRLTALTRDGEFLWETDSSLFGGSGVRLRVSASGSTVYGGGFTGLLGGFDTGSGVTKWQSYIGGEIFAPAIAIGQVFGQSSANRVYAMDSKTGAINWSYDTTDGKAMEGSSSNFPPTYVNGALIVSTGHIAPGGASLSNNILALDARSGKLLWSADLGLERATQPTVSNGTVFVQTENRLIAYGINLSAAGKTPKIEANGLFRIFIPAVLRPPCS